MTDKIEPIESVRKAVLYEWFGTEDLNWVKNCPKDEIGVGDVIGCIDIAISEVSRRIFKDLNNFWKEERIKYSDIAQPIIDGFLSSLEEQLKRRWKNDIRRPTNQKI